MNVCICGGHFWHVNFGGGGGTLPCLRFVPLLFLGCMPYGIFSVTWMVLCNNRLLHVVPMILYILAYCDLIFLSLVGLTLCGCNQILQICACGLIGGDKFLILCVYLYRLLPASVICPTIGGGSIYLRCIVPL